MSGASPCPLCGIDVIRERFPRHLNSHHEGCDLVELNARLVPFDRMSRCHTCPKMTRERYKLIHKCKGPEYDPNAVDGEDDIESLLAEFEEEDPENGVAVLGSLMTSPLSRAPKWDSRGKWKSSRHSPPSSALLSTLRN